MQTYETYTNRLLNKKVLFHEFFAYNYVSKIIIKIFYFFSSMSVFLVVLSVTVLAMKNTVELEE